MYTSRSYDHNIIDHLSPSKQLKELYKTSKKRQDKLPKYNRTQIYDFIFDNIIL